MFRKILVPTDGSDNSKPAISYALDLAKLIGAEVTTMCVVDETNFASLPAGRKPEAESELHHECREAVGYVVGEGRGRGLEVRAVVITGLPARDIIGASKDYDLIVMGTVGRTGLAHALLGSVAEKVVRNAACPVLVVRESMVKKE